MGKRKRKLGKKISSEHTVREVEVTPIRYSGYCPTNLQEAKELFMTRGIVPRFVFQGRASRSHKRAANTSRGRTSNELLPEATFILEKVREKYVDGKQFMEMAYGARIDYITATDIVSEYLKDNHLSEQIEVYWAPDLNCSARMMWHGPNQRYNKPEARRYKLFLNSTEDNSLLRETGIKCLCHHEIGTHFMRMVNDGLQPWYSGRSRFGLEESGARAVVATEEGLAAVNTALFAQSKLLYSAAILYYTSCMAQVMGFTELFKHLSRYTPDVDQRWKHVSRVKRGQRDPEKPGGLGNDQCYFEGAVELLRHADQVDFNVLYSGRLSLEEARRVKRVARQNCLKLPDFVKDETRYRKGLRQMAIVNGLIKKPEPPPVKPETLRVNCLSKGRTLSSGTKSKAGSLRGSCPKTGVLHENRSRVAHSPDYKSPYKHRNLNQSCSQAKTVHRPRFRKPPGLDALPQRSDDKSNSASTTGCGNGSTSSSASSDSSRRRESVIIKQRYSMGVARGKASPYSYTPGGDQGDSGSIYSCDGGDSASEAGDSVASCDVTNWRQSLSLKDRLLYRPRSSQYKLTSS